jgi:hypothetical protein
MKFGAKKTPTVLAGGSRFAPNFIQNQSLYSVEKKIVGISQYAYFSSGLRGHRRTYLTILESTYHAIFKMLRFFFFLRPLRPELDVIQKNCRVRIVGISQYGYFSLGFKSHLADLAG